MARHRRRRVVMAYQAVQSKHMEGRARITVDRRGNPDIAMWCLNVPADWQFPLVGQVRAPTGRGWTFRLAFNQLAHERSVIQKWIDTFVATHAMSAASKAEFIRMMKARRKDLVSFRRLDKNGVAHTLDCVLIADKADL